MRGTLLFGGVVQLVASVAFLLVATIVWRRPVAPPGRAPALGFVAWWAGIASYMTIQGSLQVIAGLSDPPVEVFIAARVVTIPILCVSSWGLSYHILYLYTGRAGVGIPVAVFYGFVMIAFYIASFRTMPDGLTLDAWVAELRGTGEGPLYRGVYAAVGLPPIAASLAYVSLVGRAELPSQKYRVALVGLGILGWVGSGLAARLGGGDLAKFVTLTVFGLGAAAAVVLAYHPPRPVRAWLARRDDEAEAAEARGGRLNAAYLMGRPST